MDQSVNWFAIYHDVSIKILEEFIIYLNKIYENLEEFNFFLHPYRENVNDELDFLFKHAHMNFFTYRKFILAIF